jgi:hypothetical protein
MTTILDGKTYYDLIAAGAANLKVNAQEVNELNVFPIPDGDTGDNMLLTISGGVKTENTEDNLGKSANKISKNMLLSARGNSGVILSQFFAGISASLSPLESADAKAFGDAFETGVEHAYQAVLTPTEGTILTVMKDATRFARSRDAHNIGEFLELFCEEAKRSLQRTPSLLACLKEAGVVDSGGAGLIYIIEGMLRCLNGEKIERVSSVLPATASTVDVDMFTEDSEMEFGYCTEVLLRLQNKKCNIADFDANVITDYLQSVGNSVVAVKSGSIVKIHVHTFEPYKVLQFLQQFGEYLTVKVENMSLQHNETQEVKSATKERPKYAIVAVASGEGIIKTFRELGANYVVSGGQSMNPSSEDFIKAFDDVNAEFVYVLPNNSNVILAAKQAAEIYDKSRVMVIESKTIGDGYAVLSMLDYDSDDPDVIFDELRSAMDNVKTVEISKASRNATVNGVSVKEGEYIGFEGKNILYSSADKAETARGACDTIDKDEFSIVIIVRGASTTEAESADLAAYLRANSPLLEVYEIDGKQDVFDYIIIAE